MELGLDMVTAFQLGCAPRQINKCYTRDSRTWFAADKRPLEIIFPNICFPTLQNRPPWIPPMTCAENRHPRLGRDRQITLLRVIPALTHDSDIVSDIYYSIILRYHLEVYTAYLS